MAGIIIIGGLIIYLIISLLAIWLGISVAKEQGKPGWKGGLFMATVMYMILFWDQIPFHVAHKYYCSTEGGFTLNKTLDEWKKENPGIAETLAPAGNVESEKVGAKERYPLNQRFAWDVITSDKILGIRKWDERIVDVATDEVIARYVDFDSNQKTLEPEEFRDFKIWIHINSCETREGQVLRPLKYRFNKSLYYFQNLKEYK
jgi:hypothetical protein